MKLLFCDAICDGVEVLMFDGLCVFLLGERGNCEHAVIRPHHQSNYVKGNFHYNAFLNIYHSTSLLVTVHGGAPLFQLRQRDHMQRI